MGATRQQLMSVSYVTDYDCGNYHVGEVDFGIISGELEDYIKQYGSVELIVTLSFLMERINEISRKIKEEKNPCHDVQVNSCVKEEENQDGDK